MLKNVKLDKSNRNKFIGLSLISLFVANFNIKSMNIMINWTSIVLSIMLACVLYWYFSIKVVEIKENKSDWVLAFVFGLCHAIGYGLIQGGFGSVAVGIVSLIGYSLYYTFIGICILRIATNIPRYKRDDKYNNKLLTMIYKNKALVYMLFILCGWMICYIVYFPGLLMQDTVTEVLQYYQIPNSCSSEVNLINPEQLITGHHSIVHVIILGKILDLGYKLTGDLDAGIMIYSILQMIVMSFVISLMLKELKAYIGNKWTVRLMVLISLHPVFPVYSMLVTKDIYFCALFILYMLMYIRMYKDETVVNNFKFSACMVVIIVISCMFRNNAIYSYVLTMLVYCIMYKKTRITHIRNLLAVVVMYTVVNLIFINVLEFTPGSKKEMLSIPFQQTAACVVADNITDSEKEIVDKILEYDKIEDCYRPDKSDDVKALFRKDSSKEDLVNYMITWIKMGIKHPLIYTEALVNQIYGYFFISVKDSVNYNYINSDIARQILINNGLKLKEAKPEKFIELSYMCLNILIQSLPFILIITDAGAYVWIWILGGLVMKKLYKLRTSDIIKYYLPFISYFLIILAGPVNGTIYFRYMAPFLFTIPISLIPIIGGGYFDNSKFK